MAAQAPSSLSEQEIAELRDAFSLFDLDRSGAIDARELGTVMRSLGANPSADELRAMVAEVDEDGSGEIDFDEFCQLMSRSFQGEGKADEEMREAFRVFDEENTGFMSVASLRQIISGLTQPSSVNLSDEEVEEIVQLVDSDGDGRVSYQRLVDLMRGGAPVVAAPAAPAVPVRVPVAASLGPPAQALPPPVASSLAAMRALHASASNV